MTPEHRLITVASRSATELPLSALLSNGAINVYPQIETKGLLFLQFQGGRVTITAGKYVGLIPLNAHISVEVRPKLPVGNLARVLDYARGSLGSVSLDRYYDLSDSQGMTMLEFLLSNLLSALVEVQRHGFLKNYVRRQMAGPPHGRLLADRTMKGPWSRGERHRVISEAFEQTVDVPPNRLIKQAVECAMIALRRARPESPVLKRSNAIYRQIPRAIGSLKSGDRADVRSTIRSRNLPTARAYYYRPLDIASLILSNASVSLEKPSGDEIQLETFILDFEDLFERYLRRALELRAPMGCAVKDGNEEGSRSLYDDRPEPLAQPDIVVERPNVDPLIVEVKYKEKPDRADVNQVVTYASSYRASSVVLVHQAKTGAKKGLAVRGVINGVTIYVYAFDLAAAELDAEEEALSIAIFNLIPGIPQLIAA